MVKFTFKLCSVVLLFIAGCSSEKQISFKGYKGRETEYECKCSLPKGYTKRSYAQYHYQVHEYWYKDSSVIRYTDALEGIESQERFDKFGSGVRLDMIGYDSLLLEGVSDNGKFWKERKYYQVKVGYYRVPAAKKDLFDRILNEMKCSSSKFKE
ncbi:hypothetical protein [Pedobacter paludis]|uniref:Uncharacterized protein n=1 Tax=Pedobacter paludis TaxID=2203212 RepID=A0A317EZG7_9SPHI|nr:hypothetical protein [Pedobacter paludis]PWS32254.1 hypothetical protein DF947_10830 [Pedobacter paludis]